MTDSAAFDAAYTQLNAEQKEAVDTIEGPVMVIAGPGTGKTQVLTLRIANILLQTDTAPEQILALTFTEAGAKAMRERLHRYIGAAAYRVPIYTFHGFANELIADFPESYQNVIGGRPASEIDKIKIFEQILDNPDLHVIRTVKSPYHNLGKVKDIISKLKQEYVTPDRLKDIVADQEQALQDVEQFHTKGAHKGKETKAYRDAKQDLQKNQELLAVYQQYEQLLHEQKLFDYDDMLIETVQALKQDNEMRLEVQSTYQYVLADEHQDINGVQNELLDQITSFHETPNIFAVGDEKQAIFRFQGASLENFLLFANTYKNCKQISLTKNYRSIQEILDTAQALVAVEDGPLKDLRVPLDSQVNGKAVIEKRTFSHQAIEDDWVVTKVQEELAAGVPAAEIAILVRNNYSVEELSFLLRKAGIPVSASAESDILDHPITRAVTQLMTVTAEPHNDYAWFSILNQPYSGISIGDIAVIMQARRYDQPLSVVLESELQNPQLELATRSTVEELYELIVQARKKSVTEGAHRVVEFLIKESGLLTHVTQSDPMNGPRVIRRLYDEIERLIVGGEVKDIDGVLQTFKTYQEYGIALSAPYINTTENAVSVMSVHKAKGLEYETVILPRLTDKAWGGGRKSRYFNIPLAHYELDTERAALADEERLLFVALTRAKRHVFLSHAETNSEGVELLQTRMFDAFPVANISIVSTDEIENNFSVTKDMGVFPDTAQLEPEALFELFKQKGFSATSLNNYVTSPFTYLYQNLLLIPQVQSTPLQFGSLVHNVLERSTRYFLQERKLPDVNKIIEWLELGLNKLPLHTHEYTRMHEHALEVVMGYLNEYGKSWPAAMEPERKFEAELETDITSCPTVRLTGTFDRIDFDKNGQAVVVIDYKTGKPKSRNEIEGKTKNSDGNYKRQLVFYALLLELQTDARFKTKQMRLSFVEPNTTGKFKEETFEITVEEISALRDEIISAAKAIASGEIWQQACDSTVCEYCHLLPTKKQPT